jgi:DNA-directed RNA polymerase specialized sigma subunit
MLKAEKLSKYFIAMAKKIKVNSLEMGEIKQVMYNHKNKSKREQFMELYNQNNELNRTKVGETLGVSRMQIIRWIKELSK